MLSGEDAKTLVSLTEALNSFGKNNKGIEESIKSLLKTSKEERKNFIKEDVSFKDTRGLLNEFMSYMELIGNIKRQFEDISENNYQILADKTIHFDDREEVRKKLGISSDKKIILYAPTFREYSRDTSQNCIMTPPLDLSKWKKELGQDYILLFRAHYEIVKVMNIVNDDFCKDVSDYPSLNELMIVSDLLISDYSSVFFDYSIQNKPMITFCYDYDDYARERGMYFDIREELKSDNKDEDQLITTIKNLVFDESINITKSFRDKYVTEYGNACSQSLEIIYENISN